MASFDRAALFPGSHRVRLNHGSYGLAPLSVIDEYNKLHQSCVVEPEIFHRERVTQKLSQTADSLAAYLSVEKSRIELTANATSAFRLALWDLSLKFTSIVITDVTYPSVKQAVLEWEAQQPGQRSVTVVPVLDLLIAGRREGVVDRIVSAATACSLVIVDQIPSGFPVELPVEDIVRQVNDEALVVVDGAHGIGTLDRPVPDGAVWFCSPHKWLYSPAAAGVLVWPDADRTPSNTVLRMGTQDYSALSTIPTAIGFPERDLSVGWEVLRAEIAELTQAGLNHLQESVGGVVTHDPRLPMGVLITEIPAQKTPVDYMTWFRNNGVEVAVFAVDGKVALRVSGQAYVTLNDFDRLADLTKTANL